MAIHEYTPQQALDTLMRKLQEQDIILASHVREAIDAGKEVLEGEATRGRRGAARTYRLRVPFTPEEALDTALTCLAAYFIEQPRCVNAALDELTKSGLSRQGAPASRAARFDLGDRVCLCLNFARAPQTARTRTAQRYTLAVRRSAGLRNPESNPHEG